MKEKKRRHGHRHTARTFTDVKTSYVRIGKRVPAVLYEPLDTAVFPPEEEEVLRRVVVLVMHSDEDYLSCPTGEELAKRGFRVLCANPIVKEGIIFSQNEKLNNVHDCIRFLRTLPGVEKVVLMGHSGGGSLMSAYQCMAENGPDVFAGEEKLYPWHAHHEMLPADGIMLLDSNWGNATMQVFSLDPAVTDETSGKNLDERIDLFNPANGFDPKGSTFSQEFITRFQRAQSARNRELLKRAQERLELLKEGKGLYDDDEPFIIPGAAQSFFNNRLFAQDVRLMSHTREPQLLIHRDGTITDEIVYSVRKAENPESMTGSYHEGARYLTVRTFLSSYAIRTEEDFGYDEDHVWGIDWDSTYAAAPGNMKKIHVPTLVMGMTGGWEYLASETIYNMSAAEDKELAFVEGASHKFNPARGYEEYPGQFGDTMKTLHDYVSEWLVEDGRF